MGTNTRNTSKGKAPANPTPASNQEEASGSRPVLAPRVKAALAKLNRGDFKDKPGLTDQLGGIEEVLGNVAAAHDTLTSGDASDEELADAMLLLEQGEPPTIQI